jgi:hypothetical protein
MRVLSYFFGWRIVILCGGLATVRADVGPSVSWLADYPIARRKSAESGQALLVAFMRSDGSKPDQTLDQEIFETKAFRSFASTAILMRVDLSATVDSSGQRAALIKAFGLKRLPAVFVLAPDGEILGELGYMEGGPKTFIRAVRELVAEADRSPDEGTK